MCQTLGWISRIECKFHCSRLLYCLVMSRTFRHTFVLLWVRFSLDNPQYDFLPVKTAVWRFVFYWDFCFNRANITHDGHVRFRHSFATIKETNKKEQTTLKLTAIHYFALNILTRGWHQNIKRNSIYLIFGRNYHQGVLIARGSQDLLPHHPFYQPSELAKFREESRLMSPSLFQRQ